MMTRKIKVLIPALLIILLIVVALSQRNIPTHEENHVLLNEKLIPSNHLFFQRSFPDDAPDINAIDKVRKEIHKSIQLTTQARSIDNTPWIQEGPTNIGGRINCIAVHPDDNNIIITGTSAGGIFRTTDGGDSWTPIGDNIPELSTSSITFDPSNPETIYIGTGDHNISGTVNIGDGIYKSTDGGSTWENIGLTEQRIISRVIINPENTQEIYAATMGLPFERNDERGLYKSTDGGSTWTQILFVSDEAGIIDLVMNPANPNQLYAASWNRIRNNTESMVSGTDAHIYRTNDGGSTWEIIDQGLPMGDDEPVSRIGLAITHQNPGKVYSVIVGQDLDLQGVYSLAPDGDNWESLETSSIEDALAGFGWYFGQIRVNPNNDDEIAVLGVDLWISNNGGLSWNQGAPPWWTYEVHADKHDMVYLNNNTILLATDGGLYRRENDDWVDIDNIPNSQFYRVAVNPFDDQYAGGLQDNGTVINNSNDPGSWSRERGGDGFQVIYSPDDANVVYSETQRGGIARSTFTDWVSFVNGIESSERRNWDMPIIMSSHNSDILYTGTYRIFKNTNAYVDNWQAISPQLTGDVINSGSFHTISTIGESLVDEDVLYSGSSDAKVYRSIDGGDEWTDISNGLPERYVTNIKTSPVDASIVYISHSGYKDNDNISHIHMSSDQGDTWIDISGDLPNQPINHIEVIDDEKLVVATDFGVYFTNNLGVNWERVGNNMPLVPVFDIEIDYDNARLIAGTFGRSMMSFPLDSLDNTIIGIHEIAESTIIKTYPNPVQDVLNIETDFEIKQLKLYDATGRLLFNTKVGNKSNYSMDLKTQRAGQYILEITDLKGRVYTQQIIKQ